MWEKEERNMFGSRFQKVQRNHKRCKMTKMQLFPKYAGFILHHLKKTFLLPSRLQWSQIIFYV